MLEWIKIILCSNNFDGIVLDPEDLEVPREAPTPPSSRVSDESGKGHGLPPGLIL